MIQWKVSGGLGKAPRMLPRPGTNPSYSSARQAWVPCAASIYIDFVDALAALHPTLFVVFVLFVLHFPQQLFVVFGVRKPLFPFSGLFDLARYEFGEIVEGFLNLRCRDVLVQRGLQAFSRPYLGRRFVALRG